MYPSPTITFTVDLSLGDCPTVAMGPLTNETQQGVDSPDNIIDASNQTVINNLKAARPGARTVWAPTAVMARQQVGANIGHRGLQHGDSFVLYGHQALYVRRMYCSSAYGGQAPSERAIFTCVVS